MHADKHLKLAVPPPPPEALPSSRIAAQLRLADLTSPLRLVRKALAQEKVEAGTAVEGGQRYAVLTLDTDAAQPTKLYIDPRTQLPAKAVRLEELLPLGDVRVESTFGDYRRVNGIQVPYSVVIRVNGTIVQSETRAAVELDVDSQGGYAIPPELQTPFDEDLAAWGEQRSQARLDFQYLGFTMFWTNGISYEPTDLTPFGPNVELYAGSSHSSLVVELADQLVVVETPLDDARAQTVIAAIKARHPNGSIRRRGVDEADDRRDDHARALPDRDAPLRRHADRVRSRAEAAVERGPLQSAAADQRAARDRHVRGGSQ
jgi:hypothetical protein